MALPRYIVELLTQVNKTIYEQCYKILRQILSQTLIHVWILQDTCFHLHEQTQGPSERPIRLLKERVFLSYCWLTMCLNPITILCPYRRSRNLAFAVLIIKISVLEGLLFSLIKWEIILLPKLNSEMWILKQTNNHTIKQKPQDVPFKQSEQNVT